MSLSRNWVDESGGIGRITPDGNTTRSSPKRTARISDGHNLIFGSPWDSTFEHFFDGPDGAFPSLVEGLERIQTSHEEQKPTNSEFLEHQIPDEEFEQLTLCLLSLVVRSPRFRQGVVDVVDGLRTNVPKEQYKQLIAANLRQSYSQLEDARLGDGKYLLLFAKEQEFIFGDGFYNNVPMSSIGLSNTTILAPLTPTIAVLYHLPMEYMVEPKVVSITADKQLMQDVNESVQVYSRDCLFFRSEPPEPSEHFVQKEHLRYAEGDPIDALAERIPGVRSKNRIFL